MAKKDRQKVKSLTGKSEDISSEKLTTNLKHRRNKIVNISDYLSSLKNEKIEEYKKEADKSVLTILKNGSKHFHNWSKLGLVALGAVGQATLIVEGSYVATYILAGATCLAPIIADFKENFKLVNSEIVKKKEVKNWWNKTKETGEFILPGCVALGIGFSSMAIHWALNNFDYSLASNIILSVGTFASGSAQMYVNPSVKKAVASINLKDLQKLKIDDPKLVKLLTDGTDINIEEIQALVNSRANLDILNDTTLQDLPKTIRELQEEIDENQTTSLEMLDLLNQALVLRASDNENLIKENNRLNADVNKLETIITKQKEDFEKENEAEALKIKKLEDRVYSLERESELKQEHEESLENTYIQRYLNRSSDSDVSINISQ